MRHKRAIPKYRKHTPTKRIKYKVVKPNVVFKPHRKVKSVREAKPIPIARQHRKLPKKPLPKAPFRYKHKSEYTLDWSFVGLTLLLLVLLGGFGYLLYFLLK